MVILMVIICYKRRIMVFCFLAVGISFNIRFNFKGYAGLLNVFLYKLNYFVLAYIFNNFYIIFKLKYFVLNLDR